MKWGSKYVLSALGLLNITLLLLWAQTRKAQYDVTESHNLLVDLNLHSFQEEVKKLKGRACNFVSNPRGRYHKLYKRFEDFSEWADDSVQINDILKMLEGDTTLLRMHQLSEMYGKDSFLKSWKEFSPEVIRSYPGVIRLAALSRVLEFYQQASSSCGYGGGYWDAHVDGNMPYYNLGDTLSTQFFIGLHLDYCIKDAIKSIKVGEKLYELTEADFPNPSVLHPLTNGVPERKIPIEMRISRAKGDTLIKDFWP